MGNFAEAYLDRNSDVRVVPDPLPRRKIMVAELRRRGAIELPALGVRIRQTTAYYVKEARFLGYLRQAREMLGEETAPAGPSRKG